MKITVQRLTEFIAPDPSDASMWWSTLQCGHRVKISYSKILGDCKQLECEECAKIAEGKLKEIDNAKG